MSENPIRPGPGLTILLPLIVLTAAGSIWVGCNTRQESYEPEGEESSKGNEAVLIQSTGLHPTPPSSTSQQTGVALEHLSGASPAQTMTIFVPRTGAPDTEPPCVDEAAPGRPIDVNIPDDTIMQPGQEFSKTWRLINAGTCAWNSSYQVIWYWGEQMSSAASYPLEGETAPGKPADITVNLIAPQKPGVYQSNWKLRNPDGKVFGVGPGEGLYFYVRISVAGSPVPEENDLSLIVQNTPTPFAGGPTRLLPSDRIDLDKNILNPTFGEDLAMNKSEPYYLVPFESAFFSVYGKTQPTESQCLSTEPSKTPIQVETLEPGTYLCYLTDEGRTGWMRIQNFWKFQERALLNLEVYTWPLP